MNRLLREKTHWERRIRELGGPDYAVRSIIDAFLRFRVASNKISQQRSSVKSFDDDAIVGAGGYMYFGAARKLPGVQELVKPGEGPLQFSLSARSSFIPFQLLLSFLGVGSCGYMQT